MSSGNVFVYGTLLSKYIDPRSGKIEEHTRSKVLRGFRFERALLKNYKLLWCNTMNYPFITPSQGHSVKGEVYYSVGKETINKLDEIEGVSSGLFEKTVVRVLTDGGREIEALAYVGGQPLRTLSNCPSYFTLIPEEFEKR
ncbi:MAG: gamma-glutamylcyclotransferase [Candidatus Freyarchaeota archaeon]|nr:gamma-glutamylcyclotransferase [Candidatus Jordarchaeia archaeon]MBS7279143.1 gamma-glutamylcyclotransferase [Candidatus Jordarchaeia archaeon]